MLLYLKRYEDFIDFISTNGSEYYRNNSTVEKMAAKFSVTNPGLGVKLYHYLLQKELARITKTSRYDILLGYFEDLKCLNDLEYITNLKNNLILTYPTRKKLVEVLNAFEIAEIITSVSEEGLSLLNNKCPKIFNLCGVSYRVPMLSACSPHVIRMLSAC